MKMMRNRGKWGRCPLIAKGIRAARGHGNCGITEEIQSIPVGRAHEKRESFSEVWSGIDEYRTEQDDAA